MGNRNITPLLRTAVRIIIPVLLLCAVFGIWTIKNNSNPGSTGNPDYDLHVTGTIDLEKLKSYGVPIVIDFGADYCPPCREMAPVLKELNAELQGKAIIKYVDVQKYQELTANYPVKVIPTQILINAAGQPFKPGFSETMEYRFYSQKDTGEHIFTAHEGGMTKEQLLDVLQEMGMK